MPGEGGLTEDTLGVGERIGYAQVPIEAHGPTAHRNALVALGVEPDRVYVDEGSPPRIVPGPDSARPWPPARPGTRSSAPDLTASPGLAPTRSCQRRHEPEPLVSRVVNDFLVVV